MYFNFRAGIGSGSGLCADGRAIQGMGGKTLATVCIFLFSAFASSGYGMAIQGGTQDGVTSSARQLPLGKTVTAPATKAVRTGDSRARGPEVRVKWEAGKLSLDAEGAPLSEVLQAISHETGIEVVGASGLGSRLFTRFAGMDLVQALNKLLAGVDYAIATGPPGSASARVTQVTIIDATAGSVGATSLVKAEANAPTAPDADLQESKLAAIEQVGITAPDAAQGESQPAVIEVAAATAPDAAQQESQFAAIESAAAGGDLEELRSYLQDIDPAVQAAAFHALATQAQVTAVDDLLAGVKDTSQPTRLQGLQLLAQSSEAEDQTVMAVLRDALKDPDPSFIAYAVQELAGRDNAEAMDALSAAFHSTDPSTRLMIIQSVANTQEGLPLLSEALSDTDETVSNAAAAPAQTGWIRALRRCERID